MEDVGKGLSIVCNFQIQSAILWKKEPYFIFKKRNIETLYVQSLCLNSLKMVTYNDLIQVRSQLLFLIVCYIFFYMWKAKSKTDR